MSAAHTPQPDRSVGLRLSVQNLCHSFVQPAVLIRVVLYLSLLVYLRTVFFDYVYDDSMLLLTNPWMASWKCIPAIFTHSFWGFLEIPRAIDFYRPLVMLLFAAIFHLLGPAPGWFHLIAAAMHILATYLVYRLASATTQDQSLAAVAAGIFGLHPTKVETAAWISGLSDSLSLVFFLISMLAYLKWRESREEESNALSVSAAFLLLALFSKEAAIFAPALMVIYEFNLAQSGFRNRCLAAARNVWPFVTVTVFALGIRILLAHNHTAHLITEIPLVPTMLTAPRAILWYLEKQIWPFDLSVQYPIILLQKFSLTQFLLPVLLLLITCASVIAAVRKSATGVFFLSWFVLMLAPIILYHVDLQEHDRYFYFASVATSVGLAYLVVSLKRFGLAPLTVSILALFGFMAILTFRYESYWDNDVKLFTRAVNIAPDNPNAAGYLASHYIDARQYDKAEAVAKRLIANPDLSAQGWYLLGTIRSISNEDYGSAREAFEKSREMFRHHNFLANVALASTDVKLGKNEEAVNIYREELKRYPDVGYIHGQLALALQHMDRSDDAAREFQLQRQLQ